MQAKSLARKYALAKLDVWSLVSISARTNGLITHTAASLTVS